MQDRRSGLVEALQRPRYEVIPLPGVEDAVAEHVPKHVKLTVTASPKKGLGPTLELAERLSEQGFEVAPHLSARLIRDRAQLGEILARLREADGRDVLVVAGDAAERGGASPGRGGAPGAPAPACRPGVASAGGGAARGTTPASSRVPQRCSGPWTRSGP